MLRFPVSSPTISSEAATAVRGVRFFRGVASVTSAMANDVFVEDFLLLLKSVLYLCYKISLRRYDKLRSSLVPRVAVNSVLAERIVT